MMSASANRPCDGALSLKISQIGPGLLAKQSMHGGRCSNLEKGPFHFFVYMFGGTDEEPTVGACRTLLPEVHDVEVPSL